MIVLCKDTYSGLHLPSILGAVLILNCPAHLLGQLEYISDHFEDQRKVYIVINTIELGHYS